MFSNICLLIWILILDGYSCLFQISYEVLLNSSVLCFHKTRKTMTFSSSVSWKTSDSTRTDLLLPVWFIKHFFSGGPSKLRRQTSSRGLFTQSDHQQRYLECESMINFIFSYLYRVTFIVITIICTSRVRKIQVYQHIGFQQLLPYWFSYKTHSRQAAAHLRWLVIVIEPHQPPCLVEWHK